MSTQTILLLSVIGFNVLLAIGLLWFWIRTAKRMSKVMKMQRELMSSNRGNILLNQKGIASNKKSIGVYQKSIAENKQNIEENRGNIESNREQIEAILAGQEQFKLTVRNTMFIREANAEKAAGLWCFESKGEKKYYKPGKLQKVESGEESTEFLYEEDRIVTKVTRGKRLVAEIVYTLQGAPISGTLYEKGKKLRTFKYDKLGQVESVK